MSRFAKEFDWSPADDIVRCSCGERYSDYERPNAVSKCPICGDRTCSSCSTTCPNCLRNRICKAHIIEKMPITPTHNEDVCVDCAKQILEDEAMTEKMFPARGRSAA